MKRLVILLRYIFIVLILCFGCNAYKFYSLEPDSTRSPSLYSFKPIDTEQLNINGQLGDLANNQLKFHIFLDISGSVKPKIVSDFLQEMHRNQLFNTKNTTIYGFGSFCSLLDNWGSLSVLDVERYQKQTKEDVKLSSWTDLNKVIEFAHSESIPFDKNKKNYIVIVSDDKLSILKGQQNKPVTEESLQQKIKQFNISYFLFQIGDEKGYLSKTYSRLFNSSNTRPIESIEFLTRRIRAEFTDVLIENDLNGVDNANCELQSIINNNSCVFSNSFPFYSTENGDYIQQTKVYFLPDLKSNYEIVSLNKGKSQSFFIDLNLKNAHRLFAAEVKIDSIEVCNSKVKFDIENQNYNEAAVSYFIKSNSTVKVSVPVNHAIISDYISWFNVGSKSIVNSIKIYYKVNYLVAGYGNVIKSNFKEKNGKYYLKESNEQLFELNQQKDNLNTNQVYIRMLSFFPLLLSVVLFITISFLKVLIAPNLNQRQVKVNGRVYKLTGSRCFLGSKRAKDTIAVSGLFSEKAISIIATKRKIGFNIFSPSADLVKLKVAEAVKIKDKGKLRLKSRGSVFLLKEKGIEFIVKGTKVIVK